jgi:hypothetical protein
MDETLATLKLLRGETSQPLREEIKVLLNGASDESVISCAVQVESTMLQKGISLLMEFTQPIAVRLYLSRREIPGFIPRDIKERLWSRGWEITNDQLGQEFALVYKLFSEDGDGKLEEEITQALETLGAPQKHTWKLHPTYA